MGGPKIVIDGHEYPMVDMARLTMGDARVIKRYTGLTLEALEELEGNDPDVIAAMCHLSLMRAFPKKTFSEIEAEVDAVEFAQLRFTEAEEAAEERPPAIAQNGSAADAPSSGLTSDEPSALTPETTPSPIGVSV